MRLATTLALLVTSSTLASANSIVATSDEPKVPNSWDGRLGLLLGGADVGDASGFSVGVSGGLGYRMGDLTLRALADYYRVGDSNDAAVVRRGRATRLGGAMRYSFANMGDDTGIGVDFWGEAGLGYEHVAWLSGGVLDRPSGELAVGFEVDSRGERLPNGHRKHIGYFMDFRSLVGEGPEMSGPAICAGPCTQATKPSRTDVSMFFELGIHWGR